MSAIELELAAEVEVRVTASPLPARRYGHPDNWHPADPGEFVVSGVRLTTEWGSCALTNAQAQALGLEQDPGLYDEVFGWQGDDGPDEPELGLHQ